VTFDDTSARTDEAAPAGKIAEGSDPVAQSGEHPSSTPLDLRTPGFPYGKPSSFIGTPIKPPEPTDAGPDTIADGFDLSRMSCRIYASRGPNHRFYGDPRQDHVGARLLVSTAECTEIVVALSDGVSAAPLAHLGSRDAVGAALRVASERATNRPDSDEGLTAGGVLDQRFFDAVALDIAGRHDHPQEHLAATLIVLHIRWLPNSAGPIAYVSRVGDSTAKLIRNGTIEDVFARSDDSASDAPLTSHRTSSLPLHPDAMEIRHLELRPGDALIAVSDGVSDPLSQSQNFSADFITNVAQPPSVAGLVRLLDFDRRGWDDDRSLAGVWIAE
jgi:serine/threonine protein phosphatase PrpC